MQVADGLSSASPVKNLAQLINIPLLESKKNLNKLGKGEKVHIDIDSENTDVVNEIVARLLMFGFSVFDVDIEQKVDKSDIDVTVQKIINDLDNYVLLVNQNSEEDEIEFLLNYQVFHKKDSCILIIENKYKHYHVISELEVCFKLLF